MEAISAFLETVVGYVWGLPLVVSLIGTGVLLSFLLGGFLGGIQWKGFRHAIEVIRGKYDDPDEPGEITHFQALTTALSATVGLGNIAGVAVAIHFGGPGATFWMIVAGVVGMATKFAECTLAVKYRHIDENGRVHGGPMQYIARGLGPKFKPLAAFFAFAAIWASFGAANMFQTNQVALILNENFQIAPLVTGLVLAVLTGIVIIGGIRRIAHVTSVLVPLMGGLYILGALIVILMHVDLVPGLLWQIVHDAFSGTAVGGGAAGIAVSQVLIQGVRRAAFSNEAGLGSAPIAHAAATTDEPVREGVVALLEPFIDTVVICTMTALVILVSGAWTQDLNGVALTAAAFDSILPGFGRYFVPVAVALFAYSTMLSWSYYGERALDYLTGGKSPKVLLGYKLLYCVLAVVGALWAIGPVLNFSDIMLGLMVAPNLIGIWFLYPKLKEETTRYFSRLAAGEFEADAVTAATHRHEHEERDRAMR